MPSIRTCRLRTISPIPSKCATSPGLSATDGSQPPPAPSLVAVLGGGPAMHGRACTVGGGGGEAARGADSLPLPGGGVEALRAAALAVGIRPQHVRIFPTQPAEPSFPALVR